MEPHFGVLGHNPLPRSGQALFFQTRDELADQPENEKNIFYVYTIFYNNVAVSILDYTVEAPY